MSNEKPEFCPYCKEKHICKVGIYVSVSKGKQQRYKCFECGRTFFAE